MKSSNFVNAVLISGVLALSACSSNNNDDDEVADTTAPMLQDISPADGGSVSTRQVTISGMAEDPNLAGVSLIFGSQTQIAQLDGEDFSIEVDAVEGENNYTLIAIDTEGNQSSLQGSFTVDETDPAIDFLFPDQGHSVSGRQVLILGSLDEDFPQSVNININGNDIEATLEDFQFSATVMANVGENTYTVTVTDEAGNDMQQNGNFYFGEKTAAGGSHSGAIKSGNIYVWGRNNIGQLGLGKISDIDENIDEDEDTNHPVSPEALDTETELVSIVFNQNASLALDINGDMWAWGDGDDGQLGLGANDDEIVDEEDQLSPVMVPGLPQIVSITRGYDHSMALDTNGMVWTFGDNSSGQLGDGTTDDRDYPLLVSGLSNIIQITAGSKSSYALNDQGHIWAWGRNSYGNLGQGHEDASNGLPIQVPLDAVIVSLATGRDHVLALTDDGQVYAWGLNASSQVGLQESEQWDREIHSPQLLPWFSDAVSVDANGNQSFVERSDGQIYPWGQNMLGTLGVEADGNVEAPGSAIFGLQGVSNLGVGALHVIALRNDGEFFSWGWSFEGSLGGGESTIERWGYRLPILLSMPEQAIE